MEQVGELASADLVTRMEADMMERVHRLRQLDIIPRLEVVNDNLGYEPSVRYSHLKERVAQKLGMSANVTENPDTGVIAQEVERFSSDNDVHGIIVQMPSVNANRTEELLGLIDPFKDVDGLGPDAPHMPATPMAIVRLLEHYGIDLIEANVALLGKGRLVGKPLLKYLVGVDALNVTAYDDQSDQLEIIEGINKADVIITAMGLPAGLTIDLFDNLSPKTLVDAGAAELGGVVVGDVSDGLRAHALQNGWNVTPRLGGVGPVTVRLLLENTVINAEAIGRGELIG